MMARPQVQLVAAVVVVVFAIGILTSGGNVDSGWLRFYSIAVTAALVVLGLWNRWLWRLSWVQRLQAVPRDLRGTWRGTLSSQWIDSKTGSSLPPKPAYLVLRQTFSAVSVVLITDESASKSSLARVRTGDGSAGLDYMYLNEPKSSVEHRSRMHHGSTSLSITGRPARRLHGRYWTDRDSRGELDFTERVNTTADDFESAESLFAG
jgi:hypothetical protein